MASFSFLHKSFITFLHYTFNHSNLHRGNLSVITYHQCSNFHRTQFSQISQNTSLPRTKTSTNSNLKPFIVGVPNNPTERSIFQNISARKHWLLYELRNCFVLSLFLSQGREKKTLVNQGTEWRSSGSGNTWNWTLPWIYILFIFYMECYILVEFSKEWIMLEWIRDICEEWILNLNFRKEERKCR